MYPTLSTTTQVPYYRFNPGDRQCRLMVFYIIIYLKLYDNIIIERICGEGVIKFWRFLDICWSQGMIRWRASWPDGGRPDTALTCEDFLGSLDLA